MSSSKQFNFNQQQQQQHHQHIITQANQQVITITQQPQQTFGLNLDNLSFRYFKFQFINYQDNHQFSKNQQIRLKYFF
jgi:hypothetical protein